jgi:hypothetical protein
MSQHQLHLIEIGVYPFLHYPGVLENEIQCHADYGEKHESGDKSEMFYAENRPENIAQDAGSDFH